MCFSSLLRLQEAEFDLRAPVGGKQVMQPRSGSSQRLLYSNIPFLTEIKNEPEEIELQFGSKSSQTTSETLEITCTKKNVS